MGKNVAEAALHMKTRCLLELKHPARLKSDANDVSSSQDSFSLRRGEEQTGFLHRTCQNCPVIMCNNRKINAQHGDKIEVGAKGDRAKNFFLFFCHVNFSHLELLFLDFLLLFFIEATANKRN